MRKKNVIISVFLISLAFLLMSLISPIWKIQNLGIIKNEELLSNKDIESSPFVWKNSLKYFVSERGNKEKYYQLTIYDFKTKKREASFGKGLGLGSATVIGDTLYVTATKDWSDFGKSEIYLIKSRDLKVFSEPKLIFKATEKQEIFNTSLTKNSKTGQFILAYESWDDKTVPFSIYFLQSPDGDKWSPIENVIFGKEVYVACPSIKYFGNYYYLLYGMEEFYNPNCPKCKSFVTKISRSKDLRNWNTSPTQFMVADMKEEGINNSDVDLVEFEGKTYILYGIGDQSKWQGIKYAVYNGSFKELVTSYFRYFE